MKLFTTNNNKLTPLKILPPGKEKGLQRMVERNLLELLGIRFIVSEFPTSTGGRIDTLAVDDEGAPVILEYKRYKNHNLINQALSYLLWLRNQPKEFFETFLRTQLGNVVADGIRVDWEHPRVICIAENFSRFDIDTAAVVPLRVDLLKYIYYEQGLFSLEQVKISGKQDHHEQSQSMTAEEIDAVIQAMKVQSSASPTIRAVFDELREMIKGHDTCIQEKPGKRVVTYRLGKIFAEILIQKNGLVINMRPIDYVDLRCMVENLNNGNLITLNRRIKLTRLEDVDYVFGIIKQSFQDVQ